MYQRKRLVVATVELAHEVGLDGVTASALTARARVSRKTFYEYFGNRDECIDYASEQAAKHLLELPSRGKKEEPTDERLATRVVAMLEAVKAEPMLAEFVLVHAPALGGERGRRFQERMVNGIAELLGIDQHSVGRETEVVASAIMGAIGCRIRLGEAQRVGELANEVVRLAELTWVGTQEPSPRG